MKKLSALILALTVVALGAGCDRKSKTETKQATELKPNAVKVEFYVMSQCPYGVQVENGVMPALEKLAGYVDFHLNYIVTPLGGGKFKSLHGQPEVDGNIVQLCAMKQAPGSYLDFIKCQNKNMRQIPKNWKSCAQEVGLDTKALEKCKDGPEGKELLTASAEMAKKRNARGSPTIFVDGKPYRGGRSPDDFVRAFCQAIQGDKPQACKDIPPPAKVNVIVLKDKRCKDKACRNVGRMLGQLGSLFPGLETKEVDYSSEEGKELFKTAGLKVLPAVLFDESVQEAKNGYKHIQRFLKPAGKYKSLAVGAQFDPTAEICDNQKDDTGNGKVDCDDETCKSKLVCREEIPKRLDVFVMSQCPYGVKALDAMEEVLANFKGNIDFHVNFIAQKQGDGFKALHGQPEVDENIRELCAIKHYPKNYKYMDYILCRNKNIRSKEWKSCATDGIDVKVIEKCFTGDEGKKLLAENIKIAQSLGIGGSPTWIANNKHKFSGIDAETIRRNFCKHNPGTENCDKKLSKMKGRPQGSCGK